MDTVTPIDLSEKAIAVLKAMAKPFSPKIGVVMYEAARAELDKRGWTIIGWRWVEK